MKWSFLLFSSLICLQAFAQYPATGNKARLGWQTTGDGLVYRGAIGDTTTLDPSGINNAWMLLDTASGNLYAYRAKAWRLVSGGGGGGLTMPFDSVTFNVNEADASLRELKYSEEKGYLQYGGQDSVQIPILPGIWYVRNDTSVTIPKGTVLRATGTLGASGRIKVKHMIANGSIDAMYILGIAMHDIAVGADGYAMSQGKIRQVNTQAYSEGAVLYADVDTLGGLTQTEPGNGFLKLPIAFVVHSASNGTIAVRVTSGAYMRDLHDVEVTSPATNASLYYNTAQGIWRDTTGAVLTSDTSVFARDFQISGTAGQVAYFNAANAVTSDTAFRWSAANKTLGINTSTTSGANIIIKNSQEPSRSTVVATQTFSADTTNWTRGTGWTFNGTAAVATAATGALTYTPALTITSGNAYEVTYTISGYSAGTLTARVGNALYTLPTHNATANIVVLLPIDATGGFRFTTSTFTGNLDNVSVVEISKPAPAVLAGQDDNSSTLYGEIRYPNSSSVFIGDGGRFNTAIGLVGFGEGAGFSHTTGISNVYFGYQAGYNNTSGGYSNYFGYNAGLRNTTGAFNNFFGFSSGVNNTTGAYNNFFGRESGFTNRTGSSNNYFGDQAGRGATGSYNNAFGEQALGFSSGNYNNAFGYRAGLGNTTGSGNNLFGELAGTSNTTGNYNTFIGTNAGRNSISGSFNIAISVNAAPWLRTGGSNIFIGNASGPQVAADSLSGSNNIGIGNSAADNIRAAAASNVAIGDRVDLPTNNGSNQGVYQNVLFFTGASGTGTTIAAGSRAGIKTNAPASDFHVAGEVRIDDLKPTGAPRNIVGSSSTGDLSTMAWGNGLTVSVGDTILRVDTSVILPKVNVSGTTNYLAKFTGSNAVGNSGVFESGGNIGIGTTTPRTPLDIRFSGSYPNYYTDTIARVEFNTAAGCCMDITGMYVKANGSGEQSNVGIIGEGGGVFYDKSIGIKGIGRHNDTQGPAIAYGVIGEVSASKLGSSGAIGTTIAGYFKNTAKVDGTHYGVFIETDSAGDYGVYQKGFGANYFKGNVGINTTTPAYRLDVNGDVNTTGMYKKSGTDIISGTTNRLAMFTGANTVGNSWFLQSDSVMALNDTKKMQLYGRNGKRNYLEILRGRTSIVQTNYVLVTDTAYTASTGTTSRIYTHVVDNQNADYMISTYSGGGTGGFILLDAARTGLGLNNPVNRLDVEGAAAIGATYAGGFTAPTNGLLVEGNVGIATASPSRPLHINATSAIRIPVGNFAQRGTSSAGDIRVRNDTANLEFHNGTGWQTVATQSYVTDNAISTVYIPINLYAPGDTVANTTTSKAFFMVHSGLNGYCIDSYTVKAISGSGTADIQIDKNGTGGNLQAISGTTVATKDTNIALATGDYIRGQVFNLSGTLVGLGLTLEIKKTCN